MFKALHSLVPFSSSCYPSHLTFLCSLVHTRRCAHTNTSTCTPARAHACTEIHARVNTVSHVQKQHTCTCVLSETYAHTNTRACTHTQMHTHAHKYTCPCAHATTLLFLAFMASFIFYALPRMSCVHRVDQLILFILSSYSQGPPAPRSPPVWVRFSSLLPEHSEPPSFKVLLVAVAWPAPAQFPGYIETPELPEFTDRFIGSPIQCPVSRRYSFQRFLNELGKT